MNILLTICARGGSRGVPGKNIRQVGGIPLMAYTIKHAQAFAEKHNADIALSTDSSEIRAVAQEYGLSSDYERPSNLAGDTVGKVPVIHDLLNHSEQSLSKKYDMVLDLDVTSPLRTMEDLEGGMAMIQADPRALNVFSVSPAGRNPYMNMVECDENQYCKVVKTPDAPIFARQQAPEVFELNGSFYYYRSTFFEEKNDSAITDRSLAYVMPHLCFDIDDQMDFDFLEFLLEKEKLGFSL